MLGQLVVVAINYDFVRTVSRTTYPGMPNRLDPDRKFPNWVLSGPGRAYLAYRAKSYDLTVLTYIYIYIYIHVCIYICFMKICIFVHVGL